MNDAAAPSTDAPSDGWWVPIGMLVLLIPVLATLAVVGPPDAYTSLRTAPVSIVGAVLTLLSPVFVHLDRRYVEAMSDWEPSGWYYWMVVPPLALGLPALYIYQRHARVGVP